MQTHWWWAWYSAWYCSGCCLSLALIALRYPVVHCTAFGLCTSAGLPHPISQRLKTHDCYKMYLKTKYININRDLSGTSCRWTRVIGIVCRWTHHTGGWLYSCLVYFRALSPRHDRPTSHPVNFGAYWIIELEVSKVAPPPLVVRFILKSQEQEEEKKKFGENARVNLFN